MTPQETEKKLDRLEDENDALREEVERLTREVSRRADPRPLAEAASEYLDWATDPNPTMCRDAQAMVSRQLKGVLVERLREMGR